MRTRGFTLVEMIATLLIMSVLALAAMPLIEGVARHTREQALREALRDLRHAIDRYKADVDAGKIAKETDSGYPASLSVLVDGIENKGIGGGTIYYLRSLPADPFCDPGREVERCWATRAYVSPPSDPAPGDDVFDVHSRAIETGSDGRPYREW